VAVARQIPLKVGDTTIAHGTVGAIEDRMAIQLSSAFQENRSTAS
jgi:flagellar motor switch protein FliM